jgi:acyl-CoA dehydrogenase
MADAPDDIGAIVLEQADRLLAQAVTPKILAAADQGIFQRALWDAVEEAGLPIAAVPESCDGVGLPRKAVLHLLRRTAYHCLPLPLAEVMLAREIWADAAGVLLPGVVTVAACHGRDRLHLAARGADFVLTGTVNRVPWGGVADAVLLLAHDPHGRPVWVLAPSSSFTVTPRRNVAGEPRDTLVFDGARLPAASVRPAPADDALLVRGALLRVQQMIGAMERSLGLAVDYAQVRVQFGRPIAKFQAVQQMLADAAGQLGAATAAADATCTAPLSDLPLAVAMAKARVGEAAGRVAGIAHQVHAAMGFTQEHPLHHATRRLWSWRDEFGAEPYWQERLGRFICNLGGEALWPLLADGQGAGAFGRAAS